MEKLSPAITPLSISGKRIFTILISTEYILYRNLNYDIMLRNDFLRKNKCVILAGDYKIIIKENKIPFDNKREIYDNSPAKDIMEASKLCLVDNDKKQRELNKVLEGYLSKHNSNLKLCVPN